MALVKKKNYFLWILGCQMNRSDGEKIRGILNRLGYYETKKEDEAYLIVTVACSVRQGAVDRIFGRLQKWQKKHETGDLITILTGCVLPVDQKKMARFFDIFFASSDISRLGKWLKKTGKIDQLNYFHLSPDYFSNFQAYVPIMTGCNNFCAYCVVPYVRGREVSRSAKEVIAECRRLIKVGYKEIILLGQNVNSYHSVNNNLPLNKGEPRGGYNFPKLLKEIDQIPGDYWLRFLTSHPKDFSDELIKVIKNGKHITPYLHLPIQAGDNKILKAMNRGYTVEKYLKLIAKARQVVPDLMLSTDVIVGFPGETKKQFLNTANIFKKVEFDMAYISQYSSRTGTVAAKLDDNIPAKEKMARAEAINNILKKTALKHNRLFVGQVLKILVDKCRHYKCFGKTIDYRTVTFTGSKDLIGQFVNIKIDKAESFGLNGHLI